jgi:hypothetical protein
MNVGILHPSEMGISIAASAINNGHQVYWLSVNRSEKTRSRAEKHGLIEIQSLATMCNNYEVVLSVCPPYAAEEVSRSVMSKSFAGLYLDANAISPAHASKIGQIIQGLTELLWMVESSADLYGSQLEDVIKALLKNAQGRSDAAPLCWVNSSRAYQTMLAARCFGQRIPNRRRQGDHERGG